ncbi:hypothetical protein JJC00_10015 [Bradyrhizobium diazoefficiens]|uniref:hypothetical protein n=1 Tax=Bradyrhizobium diazoefficiens TaxID=1355477 RepID=UPI00190B24FE|nr:hypothetical protein [Bradyrhizobium diazoefficiens]QQO35874.1 hypothetical protein JJC00_10015 [Bradyrhizobium diazoefficiens]
MKLLAVADWHTLDREIDRALEPCVQLRRIPRAVIRDGHDLKIQCLATIGFSKLSRQGRKDGRPERKRQ